MDPTLSVYVYVYVRAPSLSLSVQIVLSVPVPPPPSPRLSLARSDLDGGRCDRSRHLVGCQHAAATVFLGSSLRYGPASCPDSSLSVFGFALLGQRSCPVHPRLTQPPRLLAAPAPFLSLLSPVCGAPEPITSIIFPSPDAAADGDQGDQGECGGGGERAQGGEAGGRRGQGFGGFATGVSNSCGLNRMVTASNDQTVRVWDLVHQAEIDAQARM